MARKTITFSILLMSGAVLLLLPGCDFSCFGKGSYCRSDTEMAEISENIRRDREERERKMAAEEECWARKRKGSNEFTVDPFGLAGRPSSERARLVHASESMVSFEVLNPQKDDAKIRSGWKYNDLSIRSINGVEVNIEPRGKGCVDDAVFVPPGDVEVVFSQPLSKSPPPRYKLRVDPGEDVYLGTMSIKLEVVEESFLSKETSYKGNLIIAELAELPVKRSGDSEVPPEMISAGFIIESATWSQVNGMLWGDRNTADTAQWFVSGVFERGLSDQLPGARKAEDFSLSFKAMPYRQFEARRRELAESARQMVEAGLAASSPGDTRGFVYPGRYILTKGNHCVEMKSDTGRFFEISKDPNQAGPYYYVSYGRFFHDDPNTITWPEKPKRDGSIQWVFEDPGSRSQENDGPTIIQHRMTVKPRNRDHLMVTQWTETKIDMTTKAAIWHRDRMDRSAWQEIGWYLDQLGDDGYCLRRTQQPLN